MIATMDALWKEWWITNPFQERNKINLFMIVILTEEEKHQLAVLVPCSLLNSWISPFLFIHRKHDSCMFWCRKIHYNTIIVLVFGKWKASHVWGRKMKNIQKICFIKMFKTTEIIFWFQKVNGLILDESKMHYSYLGIE